MTARDASLVVQYSSTPGNPSTGRGATPDAELGYFRSTTATDTAQKEFANGMYQPQPPANVTEARENARHMADGLNGDVNAKAILKLVSSY